MTGPRSRYEPGSVGKARDGVEAPVRQVLGTRDGVRPRAGMIAVAIVAIMVVAAGIGLAGRGLPDSEASPSDGASGSPAASGSARPERTPQPGVGCGTVKPADLPEFQLSSTRGEAPAVEGVAAAAPSPDASPPTASWPTPGLSSTLTMNGQSQLVLIPNDEACVLDAFAEFASPGSDGAPPITLGDFALDPPRKRVILGSLPGGAWVVRVVVRYATDATTGGEPPVIERFFAVNSVYDPNVSPEVTPTVPCGALDPGAPLPDLLLIAGDSPPVRGVDLATYPGDLLRNGALVNAAFPDRLVLLVDGEACATSWKIQWLDYATGAVISELAQENLDHNPYRVSQNRIDLSGGLVGQTVVTATLDFDGVRTARAAWEVTTTAPPVPELTVRGPVGDGVSGVASCGSGWSDASGLNAYESCPEWLISDDVGLITVRSGDILTADAPGWTLQNWSVACGTRGGPDHRQFENFGCDLGGGVARPMNFLPYEGSVVLLVQISVIRDDISIYASYFVEVVVEP